MTDNAELTTIGHAYNQIAMAAQVATLEAENKRLREAITNYLDGGYDRPLGKMWRADGKPSKHDLCVHGSSMYQSCENCIDSHFEAALTPPKEKADE